MIGVPQAADQFDNADRLVEPGVARRIDLATVTADELRAALLELTGDAAVRRRAAEIRDEVRAGSGAGHAATLIEAELPVPAVSSGARSPA